MHSLSRRWLAAAVSLVPAALPAQRDTLLSSQGLPRDVAREAASLYNAAATLRVSGPLDIEAGRVVNGDVAVLNGPVTLAGHVTGRVLAINADVVLKPSARVDGDLLVVGGDVEGRNDAEVGGEIRMYRQPLRFTVEGNRIVADRDTAPDEDTWWRRWERRRSRSWSKLQIASAGAYNRVEGLPIDLGPQAQRVTPWGRLSLDAYAVLRTGSSFGPGENDVGHNVRAEVQLGRSNGLAFGGRAFNVVNGVEPWQLSDLEVGLASFLFHRDYRDYYERHGADAYVTGFLRRGLRATASLGAERWSSRRLHNPFTLFDYNTAWRANPDVDEGLVHLGTLSLRLDTRNDPEHPASGWYVTTDLERGAGTLTAPPPRVFALAIFAPPGPRRVDYSRAFVDVRRYNRVSPDAELNFRVVLGGWLGGSPLPLERRLSVDGPGALPGFGFRTASPGSNFRTCSLTAGFPEPQAACERIALAQAEYRGDLHVGFGDDDGGGSHFGSAGDLSFRSDGKFVLFMDAGRGWLVHAAPGPLTYPADRLPPLATFRSDLGGGLDFGLFGVYAAKALSRGGGEPVHFFVRLRHRF